jgi:hypothetical protein
MLLELAGEAPLVASSFIEALKINNRALGYDSHFAMPGAGAGVDLSCRTSNGYGTGGHPAWYYGERIVLRGRYI